MGGVAFEEEAPVILRRSASWSIRAGGDPAQAHRILLAWPEGEPPPGGFPVLFLADGNANFATTVEAARARAWRGASADVAPAVIVGLGHAGEEPFDPVARSRDYTPAARDAPPGTGGADAFLHFLAEELLPALDRRFPINHGRLALFGHSYGGLLALQALFTRPGLFHYLVAASPSLWFAGEAPMAAARGFAANPPPAARRSGLLVTVGALEEENDGGPHGARRAARRMVTHARALATLLRDGGLAVDYVEFPGENHGSVVPAAIARGLRFALPPQPGRPA